jgi:hypothetical protein
MLEKKPLVVYVLTRGYVGIRKFRYFQLIKRNFFIWKVFGNIDAEFYFFHEGNITKFEQWTLRCLTFFKMRFIDIASDFAPHPNNIWTRDSDFPISYSLMCQFQYMHVWKYLCDFENAIRVDEDCKMLSLPKEPTGEILECGALCGESHANTNTSLPLVLDDLGYLQYYDHSFPYTNVFVTKVDFWLQKPVQEFLYRLYSHPLSLEHRWGDLPIIGVTLKIFGEWKSDRAINDQIKYFHSSHDALVEHGRVSGKYF